MSINFDTIEIIDYKFTTKGDYSKVDLTKLPSSIIEIDTKEKFNIVIELFSIYNYRQFITEIVQIRDELKKSKVVLKGYFTGILRTNDGKFSSSQLFKLKSKEILMFDGDVKVLFRLKTQNEKRKILTISDKLELFKQWHNANPGIQPNDKIVYKGFNIGRFYAKCMENAKIKDSIELILSDTK